MASNTAAGSSWRSPRVVLMLIGLLLLAGIVVVSILRERIVSQNQWQVTVAGQGKVSYQSDTAIVSLGVQIDKAATAEAALSDLNKRTEKIFQAVKAVGIAETDINTQGFSVYTHYDFVDNVSQATGYDANQQLAIKVRDIANRKDLVSTVVKAATEAGANKVDGITFEVSNLEELKQQARLKAIADAKVKAMELASTAGVELKRIVSWWDNLIQAPGTYSPYYYDGKGGMGGSSTGSTMPSGIQEIIIDVGVTYQLK